MERHLIGISLVALLVASFSYAAQIGYTFDDIPYAKTATGVCKDFYGNQDGHYEWFNYDGWNSASRWDTGGGDYAIETLQANPNWRNYGVRMPDDGMTMTATGGIFDPFTIELWANRTSAAEWRCILECGDDFSLRTASGQTMYMLFSGGNTVPVTLAADSHWHHIAMVWTGTNLQLYRDGTLVTDQVLSNGLAKTGNHGLFIGNDSPGMMGAFPGLIDEFRFTDSALTPSEMLLNGSMIPEPATCGLLVACGSFAAIRRRKVL